MSRPGIFVSISLKC